MKDKYLVKDWPHISAPALTDELNKLANGDGWHLEFIVGTQYIFSRWIEVH